eukprot:2349597-Amphidinium_carterae.1
MSFQSSLPDVWFHRKIMGDIAKVAEILRLGDAQEPWAVTASGSRQSYWNVLYWSVTISEKRYRVNFWFRPWDWGVVGVHP